MSDKCGVCGRTDGLNSTGTMCFRPSFTDEDAVAAACYKLGYDRSQEALAAARRECERLRKTLLASRPFVADHFKHHALGINAQYHIDLLASIDAALAAPAAGEEGKR